MDPPERRGAHQLRAPQGPRGPLKGPGGRSPVLKTEHHRSAGGLIVRGSRILLISTQDGRRWNLPKGHIEEGETAEQTAVREVREETGVTGRVLAPLADVEYWFVERRRRIHKVVNFFLLDYVNGDASAFDPREVSGAEWFTWEEGLERLSFESERRVVQQARELVEPEVRTPAESTDRAAER